MTAADLRTWLQGLAECGALIPAEQVLARLPGESTMGGAAIGAPAADLTVERFADALGISPSRARELCREEAALQAYRRGRRWFVPLGGLRAYQVEQQQAFRAARSGTVSGSSGGSDDLERLRQDLRASRLKPKRVG